MNRRLAVFAGLFSLGLFIAILAMLSSGGPGLAGSTGVPPDAFVAKVGPGQTVCQGSASLPRDASVAQAVVGSEGTQRVKVSFIARGAGQVVVRGVAVASPGVVRIPLRRSSAREIDQVCLRNLGRRSVLFAGRAGGELRVGDSKRPDAATLSVLFVRADPPSWLSEAGTIADRFAHVRLAPLGQATLWFGLALALLAWGGAVIATVYSQRG